MNLSAEEWALLQTFRLDFCKHYCNLSGHVSGCIDGGKILEKLKTPATRYCVRGLGHSGECLFGSFIYLGEDKCSAESPDKKAEGAA